MFRRSFGEEEIVQILSRSGSSLARDPADANPDNFTFSSFDAAVSLLETKELETKELEAKELEAWSQRALGVSSGVSSQSNSESVCFSTPLGSEAACEHTGAGIEILTARLDETWNENLD
jgi:hypothetical protein